MVTPCIPRQSPGDTSCRPRTGRGTRIVKSVAFTLLASLSFAYLALCAYGISKTGSTAGLADIGNAAVLCATATALAMIVKQ